MPDDLTSTHGEGPPPDDGVRLGTPIERADPGPPPLQFRIKHLLVATFALSVVFALAGRMSGVLLAALIWLLLLVLAHVVATAMGTRASAFAPSRMRAGEDRPSRVQDFDRGRDCAPTTRLGGNDRLSVGFWVGIGIGTVVGCAVGTILVAFHNGGRLGWSGLSLAAISSAGIGAFLSFLAGSCARVAGRAWREASHSAGPRR